LFWGDRFETVRPMLSDRCLSVCLHVCLSVYNVGVLSQTVGWIKMKLGMQVGLGPGHIVLGRNPATLYKRGGAESPIFGPCLL